MNCKKIVMTEVNSPYKARSDLIDPKTQYVVLKFADSKSSKLTPAIVLQNSLQNIRF